MTEDKYETLTRFNAVTDSFDGGIWLECLICCGARWVKLPLEYPYSLANAVSVAEKHLEEVHS